jgi:hypothetical protein
MKNFGGRHQPENRFSAVRHGNSANREWAVDDKLLGGYFGEYPVSYETALARAEYLNGPEGKAALAAQGTWHPGPYSATPVALEGR